MIKRTGFLQKLNRMLSVFPVTAILGPRQCGKTTIAKEIKADHFFDLENPRDAAKFFEPQLFLESLSGMIVIDEVQRMPELFPLLRYLVDNRTDQKYLLLGSASRKLISQGSESLAGRIGFLELNGFSLSEIRKNDWQKLWVRGGFPRAYLADSNEDGALWRENYITTFLEQDIPQLGINIPATTLRRFWMMLAHYHGQVLNYSELGRSFGISDVTARKYIDILTGTFMVRLLQPWFSNSSKRQVKSPKVYLRDSGVFHSLIGIDSFDELSANPKIGASWEGFALEQIAGIMEKSNSQLFFWGTHGGAEVDLFFISNGKNYGVEFKYTSTPKISKSMLSGIEDLNLDHLWVVVPNTISFKLAANISVVSPENFKQI